MYPLSPSDRGGLKTRAKEAIRGTSGVYLVTILYLLLTNLPDLALYRGTIATMLRSGDPEVMLQIWTNRADSLGAGAALVSTLLSLVLSIIEYSYSQYSLRIGRGVQVNKTDELFSCFARFWDFFVLNLLTSIFVALWSLLLVIPGIIAALAYSQAAFVLMDNPGMPAMEAIRRSKELMQGHKGEYFLLLLSFLGWDILCGFTAGILLIWVAPYQAVTQALYYDALCGGQPTQSPWTEPGMNNNPDPPQQDRWWEEQ